MDKPNFVDYVGEDGEGIEGKTFKGYIVDMLRYLQEIEFPDADWFDVEFAEATLPDNFDLDADPRNLGVTAQVLLRTLMRSSVGAEIFDPLLARIGSSLEEIRGVVENGPEKRVPGVKVNKSSANGSSVQDELIEQMKLKVLKDLHPVLIKAAATGRTSDIDERVAVMKEAFDRTVERVDGAPSDKESALTHIKEIIDSTEFFGRLVNAELTSKEMYSRFMNILKKHFLDERVDGINESIFTHEHDDHDADSCRYAQAAELNAPIMHLLWQRDFNIPDQKYPGIYDADDIIGVVYNAFDHRVEFVGLSIHQAFTEDVMTNVTESVTENNDRIKNETMELLSSYLNDHPELMEFISEKHSEDGEHTAIMVGSETATASIDILEIAYAQVVSEFDEGLASLADDIDEAFAKLLASD